MDDLLQYNAYEAANAGLLSPELAAGIRRVKGAKKLGVRLGNWLTADEARRLWHAPTDHTLKDRGDRAILAILLGCGLRRRELADLESLRFSLTWSMSSGAELSRNLELFANVDDSIEM